MHQLACGAPTQSKYRPCSIRAKVAQWKPWSRRLVFVKAQNQLFKTTQGSWVVTPSKRPKGIVHFIGGAFAGAAPQVVYSLFLDLIASCGYTVIATPYAVTFQHSVCARAVREQFLASLDELRNAGRDQERFVPSNVPVYGVGHSNGALLHLLIGSYYFCPTKANVIISFNNKQVGDAIPIPGLLSTLTPTVQAARTAPPPPLPVPLPSSSEVLQTVTSLLPPFLQADVGGRLSNAALALDQIASIVNEVGDNVTDFTPSPAESRQLVQQSYSVRDTLLVRFVDDSIDETPEMEKILKTKFPNEVNASTLPGSHITPCGGDVPLPVGPIFTPADAVAQLMKTQSQADIRRLANKVVDWLDSHCYN